MGRNCPISFLGIGAILTSSHFRRGFGVESDGIECFEKNRFRLRWELSENMMRDAIYIWSSVHFVHKDTVEFGEEKREQ